MSPSYDDPNFNFVEYIRENNIDIFEFDEMNDKDDAKSANCHTDYDNPLLLELNDFLEKNAITFEDLLNDKKIVVIPDEKTDAPRSSINLNESLKQKTDSKGNIHNSLINKSQNKLEKKLTLKRGSMFNSVVIKKPKESNSIQSFKKKLESNLRDQKGEVFSVIESEEDESNEGEDVKKQEYAQDENILKKINFENHIQRLQAPLQETKVFVEKEDENLFEKLLIERNKLKTVDIKQSTEDKSLEYSPKINSSQRSSSIQSNKSEVIPSPLNLSVESNEEDTKLKVLTTNDALNVKQEVKTLIQFQKALTLHRANTKMSGQSSTVETAEEHITEKENLEEKMTKRMTRKLILIIMTLLVFLPILDASYINIFLYDNEEMSTVHKFCLNGIDDAFTKSIENLKYIKAIQKIFTRCIDLAEDGSSLMELEAGYNSSDEQVLNIPTHRMLGGGGGKVLNLNLSQHVLSPFPPYFYYFNFSFYENYRLLLEIIDGQPNKSHYLQFIPNKTWQHSDYEYISYYEYKGFSYFRSYFSNDEISNSTIEFVYNNKANQMLQSILNILKVVIIGIVLIGGSLLFTDLINYYVVRPLDKVMTRLEFYLNNTDSLNEEIEKDSIDKMDITSAYKKALLLINDKEREKKYLSTNNETYELDSIIKVLINLISVSLGKPGNILIYLVLNIITSVTYDTSFNLNLKNQGIRFNAVILMMKITNIDNLVDTYGEVAHNILNKVYSVFHSQGLSYLGDVSTGKDLIIWKEERSKVEAHFKSYIAMLSKLFFT